MRVLMKVDITGHYWLDGDKLPRHWPARGTVGDIPDDEGARLCANGLAEPVAEDRVEKAVPAKRAEKRTEKRA